MRIIFAGVCLAVAAFLPPAAAQQAQENPPPAQQQEQFFAGIVTDLAEGHITVNRTVLGKNSEDRTFIITPETRVEGRLRVKTRVTVRFEGEKAVHIIVRAQPKK